MAGRNYYTDGWRADWDRISARDCGERISEVELMRVLGTTNDYGRDWHYALVFALRVSREDALAFADDLDADCHAVHGQCVRARDIRYKLQKNPKADCLALLSAARRICCGCHILGTYERRPEYRFFKVQEKQRLLAAKRLKALQQKDVRQLEKAYASLVSWTAPLLQEQGFGVATFARDDVLVLKTR